MAGPVAGNAGPGESAHATGPFPATGATGPAPATGATGTVPATGTAPATGRQPVDGLGTGDLVPGADLVTPAAVIAKVGRPVAGLSRWIAGAHAVAAASGRTLYIVTGEETRISYPLELLLAASPAAVWAVRSGDGRRFRDGLSSQPLRWEGSRFTAGTEPPAAEGGPPESPVPESPVPESPASESPASKGTGTAAAAHLPQLAGPGSLCIDIDRAHPPVGTIEIGGTASAVATALTGSDPAGWGTGEPVTEPWSPAEVTAFARGRAPQPTSVVVIAGNHARQAAGLLQAEPAASGVHTRLRMAIGTGAYPGSGLHGALHALAEALADQDARAMLVGWQPGPGDATRAPGRQPPVVPVGLFAGHEIVAARGVEHASAAPAEATMIVGSGSRTGCWCRFGTAAPHQALIDVMNHFRKW